MRREVGLPGPAGRDDDATLAKSRRQREGGTIASVYLFLRGVKGPLKVSRRFFLGGGECADLLPGSRKPG